MPMLTTVRMRLPVAPVHEPSRTRSAKAPMRSSTSWTSSTTLWPSTSIDVAARRAQGDVQHRPVLGDVDRLAGEHRVAAFGDAGGRGDVEQGGEHGVVDALLGVVDAQVADLEQVALGAARIGGEQLGEVRWAGRGEERRPLRRRRDVGLHRVDVRRRGALAAAGSRTTTVLVRRTRAIGRLLVAVQPGGDGLGLVGAGDEDDPTAGAVDDGGRERHAHACPGTRRRGRPDGRCRSPDHPAATTPCGRRGPSRGGRRRSARAGRRRSGGTPGRGRRRSPASGGGGRGRRRAGWRCGRGGRQGRPARRPARCRCRSHGRSAGRGRRASAAPSSRRTRRASPVRGRGALPARRRAMERAAGLAACSSMRIERPGSHTMMVRCPPTWVHRLA